VLRPLVRTANYLAIVWPALVFGVLIGAAVRAAVSSAWITRAFGASSLRSQLLAGAAGAPLMLCSCCVAPVFAAVYERTRRAGPAATLLLAAPSLNPAALALTFLLFAREVALVRLGMALLLVFGVSAVAARSAQASSGTFTACAVELAPNARQLFSSLGVEVWRLSRTTLPLIVVGVLLSALVVEAVPPEHFADTSLVVPLICVVALVSVPVALPTFAEIPLALGLLAAGAPAGAATALLIAGPAINLPSLLTVSQIASPWFAVALAAGAFATAVLGGLLV
jgi:hypothetical protein